MKRMGGFFIRADFYMDYTKERVLFMKMDSCSMRGILQKEFILGAERFIQKDS